jgi:hypothetical protein
VVLINLQAAKQGNIWRKRCCPRAPNCDTTPTVEWRDRRTRWHTWLCRVQGRHVQDGQRTRGVHSAPTVGLYPVHRHQRRG